MFGHTMVSYEQLQLYVNHSQCIELHARLKYHYLKSEKLLCQNDLDDFWARHCIQMDNDISICNEQAISIFLGKCVESDGYEICPKNPTIPITIKTHSKEDDEHKAIDGCLEDSRGRMRCPSDLHSAFEHDECFLVD